jgi:hypothetical protein
LSSVQAVKLAEIAMFDSYHKHTYTSPSKIDISEHRAPTDDSIRLFGEMRDKAIDSVVASGRIAGVACLARWVMLDDPAWNGWTIKFVVEVNGEEHFGEVYAGRADMMISSSPQDFIDAVSGKMLSAVRDVVSVAIHERLVKESVGSIVSAHSKYDKRNVE